MSASPTPIPALSYRKIPVAGGITELWCSECGFIAASPEAEYLEDLARYHECLRARSS